MGCFFSHHYWKWCLSVLTLEERHSSMSGEQATEFEFCFCAMFYTPPSGIFWFVTVWTNSSVPPTSGCRKVPWPILCRGAPFMRRSVSAFCCGICRMVFGGGWERDFLFVQTSDKCKASTKSFPSTALRAGNRSLIFPAYAKM